MNMETILTILDATTTCYRKGERVTINDDHPTTTVVTIDNMDHVDGAPADKELIDLEFLVVGVDRQAAQYHRTTLIDWLRTYPDQKQLMEGPSYIHVGAEVGDQGVAFRLFALGKVLGLWEVITPATLGLHGDDARMAAGNGLIMITGYKPFRQQGAHPHASSSD